MCVSTGSPLWRRSVARGDRRRRVGASTPRPSSWSRDALLLFTATLLIGVDCARSASYDGFEFPDRPQQDYADTSAVSDEKRLIKYLLNNYETVGVVGRPVFNTSETISVEYGMGLIQLLDLDEKNQILTTNVWCRYIWTDTLMTWEPESFGGVDHVRVPSDKIWTPDIVLYNYADTRLKEHRETMCVVSYNGQVMWIPPAIFKSTCSIDITNFPFDIQTCTLKFGSWTYDGFKLDINFYSNLSAVDVNDYVPSNEWALIDHPARKHVKYYSCCQEPYPDLTFTIRLKRIAAFYNYILVLPCVLLSFLTLVIFWLPPESPAKILLGMNIFVAFFVLLLLLAEITPPASPSIPLIGAYFCINMILITLSTFLAVIVINTHIRGDRRNKVPDWLRRVAILGLARALCMSEFLDTPEAPPASAATSASPGGHSAAAGRGQPGAGFTGCGPAPGRTTVSAGHHHHAAGPGPDDPLLAATVSSTGCTSIWSSPSRRGTLQHQQLRVPDGQRGAGYYTMCGGCGGGGGGGPGGGNSGAGGLTQQHQQHHQHHLPQPPVVDYRYLSGVSNTDAAAAVYNASVVSRAIQPPASGRQQPPPQQQQQQHVDLVSSIERCNEHIHNGRSLQTDIREIRRIIKAYVGRLQDRETNNRVAKDWRIVARVFDRLFFLIYICTIVVTLATMFPKG